MAPPLCSMATARPTLASPCATCRPSRLLRCCVMLRGWAMLLGVWLCDERLSEACLASARNVTFLTLCVSVLDSSVSAVMLACDSEQRRLRMEASFWTVLSAEFCGDDIVTSLVRCSDSGGWVKACDSLSSNEAAEPSNEACLSPSLPCCIDPLSLRCCNFPPLPCCCTSPPLLCCAEVGDCETKLMLACCAALPQFRERNSALRWLDGWLVLDRSWPIFRTDSDLTALQCNVITIQSNVMQCSTIQCNARPCDTYPPMPTFLQSYIPTFLHPCHFPHTARRCR